MANEPAPAAISNPDAPPRDAAAIDQPAVRRALPVRWISVSSQRAAIDVAAAPEFVVQSGHTMVVNAVAFARDGSLLASAAADGLVNLWDVSTGRQLRALAGGVNALSAVAFDPRGGRVAASGMDRRVFLWNVDDGRMVRTFEGHLDRVLCVGFSNKGDRLVSGSGDKLAVIWGADDGSLLQILNHDLEVVEVAFSPDDRWIATQTRDAPLPDGTAPGALRLWDAATGAELHQWKSVGKHGQRIVFDPRSRWLASSTGTQTQVVGLADYSILQQIDGIPLGVRREDNALAVLDRVGHLRFVNAESGATIAEIATENAPTPEEVAQARTAHQEGYWVQSMMDYPRFTAPDEQAVLNADGDTIAGPSIGATIGMWDTRTGGSMGVLGERLILPYRQRIRNLLLRPLLVAWHPGAPVVAIGGPDGAVRVVDLAAAAAPHLVGRHVAANEPVPIVALAWHPSSRVLASAGDDGSIRLWDTVMNRSIGSLKVPDGIQGIESLAFAPDGATLASGHGSDDTLEGKIVLWDAARGKVKQVLTDVGPAQSPRFFLRHSASPSPVSALAYSSDGRRLVSVNRLNARLSIWDAQSGEQLRSVIANADRGNAEFVNDVAISADGQQIAVAGGCPREMEAPSRIFDNVVTLFDANSGQFLASFSGHQHGVTAVAFSPRENLLASAGIDATIRLWNPATAELLKTFSGQEGHAIEVDSLSFSHDGRFVDSAGRDMSIRVWNVEQRKLTAALVVFGQDDFVWATPENYYTASRQGLKGVAFRLGRHAVPFEQFDLKLNRPDLVLERFGYAPSAVLDSYRSAYQHRLKRMGIESSAEQATYELPRVELVERPARSTNQRRITVRLRSTEASGYLARLQTYVNDVPIWGAAGADLGEKRAASGELEADVDLAPGANKLQLSVMNDRGVESLPETVEVYYHAPAEQPKLFVLAIGVSKYRQPRLELEYAAKDARDVVGMLEGFKDRYSAIEPLLLTDAQVTRERVLQARNFLEQSSIDDVAVVFVAGHGFLHAGRDYYFGTFDVDPEAPQQRGVPYDAIESLLDGIPARSKLLLVDTCHAGEVEDLPAAHLASPTEPARPSVEADQLAANVRQVRSFRGLALADEPRPTAQAGTMRALLGELFADLRRGSGATVIAAAGGAEYAQESAEWRNGVFTYTVLAGLGQQGGRKADLDGDGRVRVSELRDYVTAEVPRLTGGRQTPTARRENLEGDFILD
ncbi:MAG TPA: caspase family protein [Pirellulales bacterium]|nr:caspase family protein [Pirellulales bacterium]